MGITDPASLEEALWRELIVTGSGLVLLTVGGAVIGGAARSFSKMPSSLPLPTANPKETPRATNPG